jgi:signal transduction histidine kinase
MSIVTKFPLRDVQGKIYALCGIATDITERKAAEVALRELNEQLDQRVARRTQELAQSQARLRRLVAELTRAEERERRRLAVELHD